MATVLRSRLIEVDPKGCPTALQGIAGLVLHVRGNGGADGGADGRGWGEAWGSQAQVVTERATDSDLRAETWEVGTVEGSPSWVPDASWERWWEHGNMNFAAEGVMEP